MEIGALGQSGYLTPTMARQISLTENLDGRKKDLEARLEEVNSAIEALKRNPELENLLNLISKVRY